MRVTFRPLVVWPGQLQSTHRPSPFDAPLNKTWALLEHEVEMLGGHEIVVQLALVSADIRLDGRPRANAWPSHPGVVVNFETRYGPLQYATDTFAYWQDNLRAIALGLESLRRVDRYGISKRGEQYTGWQALPPGGDNGTPPMSVEAAARFIAGAGTADGHFDHDVADQIIHDSVLRATCYRAAAKRLHPDVGGDHAVFARLQEAKRIVETHS